MIYKKGPYLVNIMLREEEQTIACTSEGGRGNM